VFALVRFRPYFRDEIYLRSAKKGPKIFRP